MKTNMPTLNMVHVLEYDREVIYTVTPARSWKERNRPHVYMFVLVSSSYYDSL